MPANDPRRAPNRSYFERCVLTQGARRLLPRLRKAQAVGRRPGRWVALGGGGSPRGRRVSAAATHPVLATTRAFTALQGALPCRPTLHLLPPHHHHPCTLHLLNVFHSAPWTTTVYIAAAPCTSQTLHPAPSTLHLHFAVFSILAPTHTDPHPRFSKVQ